LVDFAERNGDFPWQNRHENQKVTGGNDSILGWFLLLTIMSLKPEKKTQTYWLILVPILHGNYPLVNIQKAIENCYLVRGFTH